MNSQMIRACATPPVAHPQNLHPPIALPLVAPVGPPAWRALHAKLVAGDCQAADMIAELFFGPLLARLKAKFYHLDEHMVSDGLTKAYLDYTRAPWTFDSRRGTSLLSYLSHAAAREVSNLWRGEKRRVLREQKAAMFLYGLFAAMAAASTILSDHQQDQLDMLPELSKGLSKADLAFLNLRLRGEYRTAALAEAMGLEDLPPEAQKRAVTQANQRIEKHLHRALAKHLSLLWEGVSARQPCLGPVLI